MQKLILYYFITINIVTFFVYALDKYKAIKHHRRISEKSLFKLSLLGGFVGAYLSMNIFRHKVSKGSFMIRYYLIVLAWIIWGVLYFYEINPLNFIGANPF